MYRSRDLQELCHSRNSNRADQPTVIVKIRLNDIHGPIFNNPFEAPLTIFLLSTRYWYSQRIRPTSIACGGSYELFESAWISISSPNSFRESSINFGVRHGKASSMRLMRPPTRYLIALAPSLRLVPAGNRYPPHHHLNVRTHDAGSLYAANQRTRLSPDRSIQSDQEQLEKRLDPNNRKHPFDLGKKDMEPLAARAPKPAVLPRKLRRLRGMIPN